ncbi:putative dehydrogenase [Streptosporangium becharense]|uniref:Putative dehydrogenase n=1 Tax=Streptosporangium becharense TaxID=1816182 RepID=A0A7W9MIT1_9ACTN|nr:Gfo/Idh/MocA family oxidoreductase [Streptosporangium becharense]MBB2911857.1 putative dehydrogenase [Streptosporangium becharense]MBB5822325.1 putative dehydrogenase [Streptosporangium becharense]
MTCHIGFVGAGNVAARHARVLSGFPDVRITGVADTDAARAARLARECGATPYDSHTALLRGERLDAVYVCVPPFAHGSIELDVLAAGLSLFVEKPLALDEETALRVAAAARDRRAVTAVGHHWRYMDVVGEARRRLDGRPVRLALGVWLDKVPPVPWWTRRDASGGQVIEQAVHVLDLARLLVGEVAEVSAHESGYPPDQAEGAVGAATGALLRFRDGAAGIIGATCLLGWKHRAGLEVYAEGIALRISEDRLVIDSGRGHEVVTEPGDAKRRVDRAFVDAVLRRGEDVRAPYEDALRTHRLACAVARAAVSGTPVTLDGG